MIYYWLFGGIGVLCLIGIGIIVVRKFPYLSLINTEDLPEEQAAKKKREIIQGRVARKATEIGRKMSTAMTEQATKAGTWMANAQTHLEDLERQYRGPEKKPLVETPADPKERSEALLAEAEKLARLGDATTAEEKFIEAISWNAKEERAYRGLAELYATTKRYGQAVETLDFLVKMVKRENGCRHGEGVDDGTCPASSAAHADIASYLANAAASALAQGDSYEARTRLSRAIALVPMNPRYLDMMFEACMSDGDREAAAEALDKLKVANPDNQKIGLFEERLRALPKSS